MLFNRENSGGDELRMLLGFIDADTNFDKWVTWVRLSVKQITGLTGKALYARAEAHYSSGLYSIEGESVDDELVRKMQLANALFAYVKLLPSLDAGHGNDGRKRQLGDNDKGLTALEAYKDEMNILHLAYEALEDLLEYAEEARLEEWLLSDQRRASEQLFVPNLARFNRYYMLNSTRMYYHLVPMIREVQETQIKPIITAARYAAIQAAMQAENPSEDERKLLAFAEDYVCRPLALGAISLALHRLPIEVFPDGLMQTELTGTLREKRIAGEAARKGLIVSLGEDIERGIDRLQAEVEKLDGADLQERYVEPPRAKAGIKGFCV